ncbi:MAG: YqgE/AlgH family protein [Hyphomicrobium sp.]
MATQKIKNKIDKSVSLKGQLLIAMPIMTDERFMRSVIYMCEHTQDGAMGLIINHKANHISFPDLIDRLNISSTPLEQTLAPGIRNQKVLIGGPVESGRGFVLHTEDYQCRNATLNICSGISLTATIDILKDIAFGRGPKQSLMALGYAGWAAGQLENEIQANGWLNCPADSEIIFTPDLEAKYDKALAKIGVNPAFLVGDAGHC